MTSEETIANEVISSIAEQVTVETNRDLFLVRLCDGVREVLNILSNGRKLREPYTIRVTEAISCLRKSYLNIIHGANPDNLYMCIGRYMHKTVLQILEGRLKDIAKVVIEQKIEQPLFPDTDDLRYRLWRLVAEPDMIVKTDDGVLYVIELKFQLSRIDLDTVLPKYRMQIGTYVKMLNADEGHLLVLRPDLSIYHEIVTRDKAEKYYTKVIERARQLAKAIVRKKQPEPEPGIDCRTCPYREICEEAKA